VCDPFGWDAHSRVVELDVTGSHGAEKGPTVTPNDGHQVVANLVGQPELEAMTGDGAGGDRDMTFAGSGSCLLHRFWHFAGDEGEGCVRVDSDPVGGLSLGHDDDRDMVCRPCQPSVTSNCWPTGRRHSQRPPLPGRRSRRRWHEKADRMLAVSCPARCRVPVTAAASLRPARGVRHRLGTPSARRSGRLRLARCG